MVLNTFHPSSGLKDYQNELLDALGHFLARCRDLHSPAKAFAESTVAHFGKRKRKLLLSILVITSLCQSILLLHMHILITILEMPIFMNSLD